MGRRTPGAIGLINLIDNPARYEQTVRLKLLPRAAARKRKIKTRNDRKPINDKVSNAMTKYKRKKPS